MVFFAFNCDIALWHFYDTKLKRIVYLIMCSAFVYLWKGQQCMTVET